MLAWNFGCRMWRLTLAPDVLFLGPAEYSVVMCVGFPGTWEMWQWIRLSMICCCGPRPWSRTGVIYQSCWFAGSWIWSSCIVVPGWNAADPWDGCICARWIWGISPTKIWVWLLGDWKHWKHLLPQFVSTIQYNTMLFVYRMYTNRFFLFLKDCTSKHVGPIVSYKGF